MIITEDIDVNDLNSIIKRSLVGIKPRDQIEVLDKKSIVKVSDSITSLQNAFNKIYAHTLNVKNIQSSEERRLQNIKKEVAMETRAGGNAATLAGDQATDMSGMPDIFKTLTKLVGQLDEELKNLDLTSKACACSTMEDTLGGTADIDVDVDSDGRRRRRGGRRGRFARGILGAAVAAIDVVSRAADGESPGQIAAGVGGGLAGGAAGSKLGGMLGAFGGPIGAGVGMAVGGALGYFAGSAAGDTLYNKMSKPEPLGSTSFSSRFADYINQTTQNMASWASTAQTMLVDLGITGGGIISDILGMEVGQGKGSSQNAEIAMKYFMSQGWTREQAAGIVGNLQNESGRGLDPNAFRANDAGPGQHSRGIAQWNRDRLANLAAYAKKVKRPWNELQTQLEFIQWELSSTHKAAGKRLKAATTADEAAVAFTYYEAFRGYEAGMASPNTRQRVANARALVGGQISDGANIGAISNPLPGGKYSGPGLGQPRAGGTRLHEGLDIFAPIGTPVRAMSDGVVAYSKRVSGDGGSAGFGIAVQINHNNGIVTKYAHLSELAGLQPGDKVKSGQIIGKSGDTGNAKGTQPHLHFEIWQNGALVEPANVLNAIPVTPPIDKKWATALDKKPIENTPPPSLDTVPNRQSLRNAPPPPPKQKFPYTGKKAFNDVQTRGY